MSPRVHLFLLVALFSAAASSAFPQSDKPVAFRDRRVIVSEGDGDAVITLVRNSGAGKSLTLPVVAVDGTARAHIDYAPLNDSVTFAPGDAVTTYRVHLIDNFSVDSTRLLYLAVRGTGIADTIVVEIRDNDVEASPELVAEPASVDFGAVNVGIQAVRTIMVRNTGKNDLRFGRASVTPGRESGFGVAYQPMILILGADGVTPINLGFTPPSGTAGTTQQGIVTFHTTGGGLPVVVSGRVIDTIPPTIAFMTPHERDTLIAGTSTALSVQITDNDSVTDAVVEYASDNGREHGVIQRFGNAALSLVWMIPDGLQCDRCRLRVQARDRLGNTANAQSPFFVVRAHK